MSHLSKSMIVGLCSLVILLNCQQKNEKQNNDEYQKGTFGYDLDFLSGHQEIITLKNGDAMLAICPGYQGRVMTSSSSGKRGLSYGWLNYSLIESGEILDHFNPVGGEDRFWLGPEGGQFSIFFAPGAEFTLEDWQTPAAIDTEPFTVIFTDGKSAVFEKEFKVNNYSGNAFDLKVSREIRFLDKSEIQRHFSLPDSINYVAFQSTNTITNTGQNPWTKSTGALSVWILGMFTPTDQTTVVVPFVPGNEDDLGPIVNDTYFGKVPADRLKIDDGALYFKADGKYRSKIGLSPGRARPYMGSYDAENGVLTIVYFAKPDDTRDYVNSLWELQEEPFAGDAANSYNDGPVDGGMLGPFYEMESSSPAAFLGPDESLTHIHQTIHIEGTRESLDPIVQKLFHTNLSRIEGAFKE